LIRDRATTETPLFKIIRSGARSHRPYRGRRMHFYVDTELEAAVDRWATENNMSKSGMVRLALRAYLLKHPIPKQDALDAVTGVLELVRSEP